MTKKNSDTHSGRKIPYVLGLDLGTSSVGWAAVEIKLNRKGVPNRNKPAGILGMGVRRFDAGVSGTADDISKGKDQSHAAARRAARSLRRLAWRRKRRKQRVLRQLVRWGLLPSCDSENPSSVTEALQSLDRELHSKHVTPGDRVSSNVLIYKLRAKALYEPLTPHELGRVLYHLAQRRGFISNRKAPPKADEDEGVVKASISELEADMKRTGCETLGEYLSKIDPEGDTRIDSNKRIRGRWTHRSMYENEFDRIVAKQSEFHEPLGISENVRRLRHAMFDQRPLRSQAQLIGTCDLVPGRRRAAIASIPFQRFRLEQKLGDLTYVDTDGFSKTLTKEQRDRLRVKLITEGDLTWANVRKVLGVSKKNKDTGLPYFPHEEGGDKKLVGDRTTSRLRQVVGEKLDQWETNKITELVDEIRSHSEEEVLADRLRRHWNFTDAEASAIAAVRLEPGYGSLCRRAIRLLLPKLMDGKSLATAINDTAEFQTGTAKPVSHDFLPPQGDAAKLWNARNNDARAVYQTFANPTVARTLSEMRKVVNSLIRTYGKPEYIRVELARDLKNSRSRRAELTKRRDQNQISRAKAKQRILEESGREQPSRSDVDKWLLAEECVFTCPYTGKVISPGRLFDSPEFEVEHIIPFSLSFDNSFANKTLCHRDANQRKANRTPSDAFGKTHEWENVLSRVKHFKGPYARRKLELFQRAQPSEPEFLERQLNETRYIARQATEYLGLLYGDVIESSEDDSPGKRRILVSSGSATGLLRRGWQLPKVTAGDKDRNDHRHHAIDALVVALTQDGFLQELSRAAASARDQGLERLTTEIELPWTSFIDDAKLAYERILVSCRPNRKLNGTLHKDTVFTHPKYPGAKIIDGKIHAVRRPLSQLTKNEIENIVDPKIREIVMRHLEAHKSDLKSAFADPSNHPFLTSKDGRLIPIHRVRVLRREKPRKIGSGSSERYVVPGANHHLQLIQRETPGNEPRWYGRVVNRLEAMTEFAKWKSGGATESNQPCPLNNIFLEKNERLVFTLMPGDHVLIDLEDEPQVLCRVNNISENEVELQRHNDARSATVLRKIPGGRIRRSPENLRRDHAAKVEVTPTGDTYSLRS